MLHIGDCHFVEQPNALLKHDEHHGRAFQSDRLSDLSSAPCQNSICRKYAITGVREGYGDIYRDLYRCFVFVAIQKTKYPKATRYNGDGFDVCTYASDDSGWVVIIYGSY